MTFSRDQIHESILVVCDNRGLCDFSDYVTFVFYRLSLNRKAQITPALNLTTKHTQPMPSRLTTFSLGDQMKKAASMKKSSKDIIKTSLIISRKIQ